MLVRRVALGHAAPTMRDSIEEALSAIEKQAALLRYVTNLASASDELPDPAVLVGLSETCQDIEEAAQAIRHALSADVLAIALTPSTAKP